MAVKARPFDVRHEPEDRYDIGWTETRWRLVDEDTGEIVDDAQNRRNNCNSSTIRRKVSFK